MKKKRFLSGLIAFIETIIEAFTECFDVLDFD